VKVCLQAGVRVALAVALGACDVTGPGGVTVHGEWTYHLIASNGTSGATCESSGTVSFDQSGAEFTGHAAGPVTCTGSGTAGYGKEIGGSSVRAGAITTTKVRFDVELARGLFADILCHVTTNGATINYGHMAGAVVCEADTPFSPSQQLLGTWVATR
jgi:hypothetical protein